MVLVLVAWFGLVCRGFGRCFAVFVVVFLCCWRFAVFVAAVSFCIDRTDFDFVPVGISSVGYSLLN